MISPKRKELRDELAELLIRFAFFDVPVEQEIKILVRQLDKMDKKRVDRKRHLTQEQRAEIAKRIDDVGVLAREYKVSTTTIRRIRVRHVMNCKEYVAGQALS